MRDLFEELGVAAIAVIICIVVAIGATVGGIVWTRTLGVAVKDAEREAYKATMTYNEGMIDDLAKYYREFNQTEDDIEKAAIAEFVVSRFSNFDVERIENDDLRDFVDNCLAGVY